MRSFGCAYHLSAMILPAFINLLQEQNTVQCIRGNRVKEHVQVTHIESAVYVHLVKMTKYYITAITSVTRLVDFYSFLNDLNSVQKKMHRVLPASRSVCASVWWCVKVLTRDPMGSIRQSWICWTWMDFRNKYAYPYYCISGNVS